MTDQAEKLRVLRDTALTGDRKDVAALPMVVVSGARAGVGTTTVAVNLAAVLADRGERVLVVEAAQPSGGMRAVAGIRGGVEFALADVLAGDCDFKDAVVAGPLGTDVVLGSATVRGRAGAETETSPKLLAHLAAEACRYDTIVVDLGGTLTPAVRRFWLRSQLVIIVTTPDDAALMDAYANIKRIVADDVRPRLGVQVNCATGQSVAADAERRLSSCCKKFLSLDVHALPSLPLVSNDGSKSRHALRVWEESNSEFRHAALWMGRAVGEMRARIEDAGCGGQGVQTLTRAEAGRRKRMVA